MAKFEEKKDGNVDVSFTIGSMPMKIYEQFISTAKIDYGDCYWLYVKDMMEKAKHYDYMVNFDKELSTLKCQVEELINHVEQSGKEDHKSIEENLTLGKKRD